MGDDAQPGSPVAQLAAQVNRFGASAPGPYQFAPVPFPLSSTLDLLLAQVALLIYQRRLTDAYTQVRDAGTAAAINAANAGFADPVAFVSPRVAQVTSTIATFADALGLAPADGGAASGDGISAGTLVLAAVVLGAWWLMEDR
jgi:hypothetical protein